MYELRIQSSSKSWTVSLGSGTRWRIGRKADCEICVSDRRISSEHAELRLSEGRLHLRRTKGQLRIQVSGQVTDEAILASGMTFTIGRTHFTLVAVREGMNLIDTQAVLSSGELKKLTVPGESSNNSYVPVQPKELGEELYSSSHDMRPMAQLLALVGSASDRDALAQAVLDLACSRLGATRALLAEVRDAENVVLIADRGLPDDSDIKSLISTTVLKQIIDERQAVLIGNTRSPSAGLERQDSILRNRIQAVACSPVFDTRGQLVALLYADNQDRPSEFSTREAEWLIWLGQIYQLLAEILEMRRNLQVEIKTLKSSAIRRVQLVAEAPGMIQVLERVKKAADTDATVLIEGESGTGKECIVRLLHQQSPRSKLPLVARSCADIPENLFESEMFGHKKGAFTGAYQDRKGAFAEADGGTLFLDEIGELDYNLQRKFLRAIQEKTIRPIGGERDIRVNVRFVCATNRDLQEACRNGRFREDLYYRLATVTLKIPPLRDRKEDIIPLARYFASLCGDTDRTLTPDAEQRLLNYDWPGNVRQLRSIVEQAIIFAAGKQIRAAELDLPSLDEKRIDLESLSLDEMERRHILRVLQKVKGNRTEAAKILGLARSTLQLKLKSFEKTS